jgi:hypothetical protein
VGTAGICAEQIIAVRITFTGAIQRIALESRCALQGILGSRRQTSQRPEPFGSAYAEMSGIPSGQLGFRKILFQPGTHWNLALGRTDHNASEIQGARFGIKIINHARLSQVHDILSTARELRQAFGIYLDAQWSSLNSRKRARHRKKAFNICPAIPCTTAS